MEAPLIDGLEKILDGSGQPGLAELREAVHELLGGPQATGRLLDQQNLKKRATRVYRLQFALSGGIRSLVVKRMEPGIAWLNQLVAIRWLPAVGLGDSGPALLGAVADRTGQCVWHVYEDLGDCALDARDPDPERVRAAVGLMVQLHTRFAGHPLLAECRMYGGDLGIYFYSSNLRDAIRGLEWLQPPAIKLSSAHLALRERLLKRLYALLDEQPIRARALAELGGPETLLHGDLWTTNTFVCPTAHGLQARLIDWDHAAVGPASYDLSTFLLRFPSQHRPWILELYRTAATQAGWRLPGAKDLNLLFETAEWARYANCLIWPAIALVRERADWGFDTLAEVERWFEEMQPVLCEVDETRVGSAVPL